MGVRELEQLDLEGLATHHPDELLDQVLPEVERRYTYHDLYHRWEHQHWQATEIDFSRDREDFAGMPQALRDQLVQTFAAFYQGEESVTRNLAPILLGCPRPEHELFLSTQIVDEARHVVFFTRVFNEVVGWEGGAGEHLEQLRPQYGRWYRNLFFGETGLDGVADRLRRDPSDRGQFVETVTLYHLILETGLALVGQRFLLDLCRAMGGLPGFYKGFMAVTRDESRHVGFGVRLVRELCEEQPELRARVMSTMYRHMPDVVRLLQPPDEDYNLELLDIIPADYLMTPQEGHRYSLTHILKRLRAAGFPADEVNALGAFAWAEFEKALTEWEERTGGTHYARLYAEDHAKGPARVA